MSGPIAKSVHAHGIRSVVGVPVRVEGRLWGAITTGMTREEPLPEDTESRLGEFTELMATAIANAEARGEVDRLAQEQAALRRVAVLVAQQPSPGEVFTAVTEAVGLLLDADLAVLHVFPGDGKTTTIASWSADGQSLPIGTRFTLDGDGLATRIFESGAPARLHSSDEAWERLATDRARALGVRSAVGAPILVEGKLWGALMAATRRVEPWAENAETRIAAFTELVATAIANAESREALAELANEQAALRRVATLVARGASPPVLFEAVAEEVGRLLPVVSATMGRFDPDDTRYHGGLVELHRGCVSYRQAVADQGHERRVDGAPDGPAGSDRRLLYCQRPDRRRRAGGGLQVGGWKPDRRRGPSLGRHDGHLERRADAAGH